MSVPVNASGAVDVTAVTPADIRMARALVADAARRGTRESAHIEAIARMKTPEERQKAS